FGCSIGSSSKRQNNNAQAARKHGQGKDPISEIITMKHHKSGPKRTLPLRNPGAQFHSAAAKLQKRRTPKIPSQLIDARSPEGRAVGDFLETLRPKLAQKILTACLASKSTTSQWIETAAEQ